MVVRDRIKTWLDPPDTSTEYNAAKEKRYPQTGDWLINSDIFSKWVLGSSRYLWLHGHSGCGKTVLASTIIDHLHSNQAVCGITLKFFFTSADASKRTPDAMLRSLAFQLFSRVTDAGKTINGLFDEYGGEQPTTDSLSRAVREMMQVSERLNIVLDALDECTGRYELLEWLNEFSTGHHPNVHIIATSRYEEEFNMDFREWTQEDLGYSAKQLIMEDIKCYVHAKLQEDPFRRRWVSDSAVLQEMESTVVKKAGGM